MSFGSAWASICSINSLILAVSFSSMGIGGFCTVAVGLGKGIWPGSLRGESSWTPKTCRAANHPTSKPTLRGLSSHHVFVGKRISGWQADYKLLGFHYRSLKFNRVLRVSGFLNRNFVDGFVG